MAGEQNLDVLDMSMFDTNELEQQETQEVIPDDTVQEDIKVVDDVSQEIVDDQEEKKNLEAKEKTTNSPADSDDVFKPLAEFLKEQGFFSTLDKEIKTADDLADAFRAEVKKNEFTNLNDAQKDYLKALESGLPEEVFQQHVQNSSLLNNITDDVLESDTEICKQLIIQEAILKGNSKERAERIYQRSYDVGDSVLDAKDAKAFLLQKDAEQYQEQLAEAEKIKLEQQKNAEKQLKDLEKSVKEQNQLFEGFKVNDGLKEKVYDTMTKVVDYSPDGVPLNKLMKHRLDNPIDFETKLYFLYELTNGFKDINKFNVKSTTTAAKKLREAIEGNTFIKLGGDTNYGDPNEYSTPIVDV
jgi:hypothetical protein